MMDVSADAEPQSEEEEVESDLEEYDPPRLRRGYQVFDSRQRGREGAAEGGPGGGEGAGQADEGGVEGVKGDCWEVAPPLGACGDRGGEACLMGGGDGHGGVSNGRSGSLRSAHGAKAEPFCEQLALVL